MSALSEILSGQITGLMNAKQGEFQVNEAERAQRAADAIMKRLYQGKPMVFSAKGGLRQNPWATEPQTEEEVKVAAKNRMLAAMGGQ